MKRLFTLTISLLAAAGISLTAQTQNLAEAKALYEKGAYAEAKPAFKRLVKAQPANGNYCLWYGVCCMETGEPQEGLKYLQTAVKRRTPSGQYQLARCYDFLYRYDEAITEMEAYINDLKRRRRPTEEAEASLEILHTHQRMLKGVEQVEVIDSLVVDKAQLLDHYKLSEESGKLYSYAHYFDQAQGKQGGLVFETELGNKIYFGERQEDGRMSILKSTKQMNSWSQPTLLPDNINGAHNADYPFIMADGFTIYYAADGQGSLGGYDIFVTRYNTSTDSYLTPENVGMPFNSPYNDYLYAVDEYNNIGWFASDRYQPEGKVCIYLFIPNATKQVYNYEGMDTKKLIRLAQLREIDQTWSNQERVASARHRLKQIQSGSATPEVQEIDFVFVINDQLVYHKLTDFRSAEAKELFQSYRQLENAHKQQSYKLESMRERYAAGNAQEKQRLRDAILDQEKRMDDLHSQVKQKANEVRAAEQKTDFQ